MVQITETLDPIIGIPARLDFPTITGSLDEKHYHLKWNPLPEYSWDLIVEHGQNAEGNPTLTVQRMTDANQLLISVECTCVQERGTNLVSLVFRIWGQEFDDISYKNIITWLFVHFTVGKVITSIKSNWSLVHDHRALDEYTQGLVSISPAKAAAKTTFAQILGEHGYSNPFVIIATDAQVEVTFGHASCHKPIIRIETISTD